MSSQNVHSEQRKSFRCAISSQPQDGELKVDSVWLPVRLLDQSAGGFAILVEGTPGIEVDDVVQLHTNTGWFEVSVAYITLVEPSEAEAELKAEVETEAEDGNRVFRLGLRRLGELVPAGEDQCPRVWGQLRFHLAGLFPSPSSMVVPGIVFVLLVVMLPLAGLLMTGHLDRSVFQPVAQWGDRMVGSLSASGSGQDRQDRPSSRRSAPEKHNAGSPRPVAIPWPGGGGSLTGTAAVSAASGIDELRKTVRRLPGATAFTLPEVIGELKLSDAQQKEIRRLVGMTAEALRELDVQWQSNSRQQRWQKRPILMDEARRRAVDILTDQQRVRWEQLVEEVGAGDSELGTGR